MKHPCEIIRDTSSWLLNQKDLLTTSVADDYYAYTEEAYLQDFLEILKHLLQHFKKIFKGNFLLLNS